MALYDDGKIRFDDEFINQFDELTQDYLRIKRYNLVDSVKSEYCTIENWLYNQDVYEIEREILWFFLGHKNTTVKTCVGDFVSSLVVYDVLIKTLKDIDEQMKEENNWD
jgi:hypothetical protein